MKEKLYKKLADLILHDYQATPQLPGERELAKHYACTRTTVRAALKYLQERKMLDSHSRRGHSLVNIDNNISPALPGRQWTVIVLASQRKMSDQNFLDFLAGVIHTAGEMKINLVIREISRHAEMGEESNLEQLHPGIAADGYILAADSDILIPKLANLLVPCVVLGDSSDFDKLERKRFVQVYQPRRERIIFVLTRLVQLKHRKILLLHPSKEAINFQISDFAEDNVQIDILNVPVNNDSTIPNFEIADQVLAAIKDHTAVIICTGGATGLDIYRRIKEAGITIPERLSLVIDSGRFDYFIRVFNIASIYSSAWEEGSCCMNELFTQLRSGSVNFMIRKSHYTYCDGASVSMAMPEDEVQKFNSKISMQSAN